MLKQFIFDRIKKEGSLSFKEFMEMALYYPGHGYYTSSETEIGYKGDFYTSSHVHPVFGAMVGKQIEEMWRLIDMPHEFHIIETGAGKGYLAGDMLAYLRETDYFNAIHYTIIEINPHLQKKQEDLLAPFLHKIRWVRSLNEIKNVTGCIISNELIDAFPVHLIFADIKTVKEIYVKIKENKIIEVPGDCGACVMEYLEEFAITLAADYRTEINLEIKNWLRDAAETLQEGFIFTIDYGYSSTEYYSPARNRGTLLCYYRHQTTGNPYDHVGRQDITAHVNFSSIKKWGEEYGFAPVGYCPQGTFLVSLRIDEVLAEHYSGKEESYSGHGKPSILIAPEGMGESHKVFIQYKGQRNPQLSGFSLRNRMNML